MKIAFVGKGGSGKTTMSWLFTKVLLAKKKTVLGIDSDHNMDYASLLGLSIDSHTATFHRYHEQFRKHIGLIEDKNRSKIAYDSKYHKKFTISPFDKFSEKITHQVGENLFLQVVGLGTEDILYSDRCAHGHSAPLKYYLPMLDLKENEFAVIDGVAGVDMINFGLYLGADLIVCVVEPQKNSIRVTKQIIQLLEKLNIPYGVIINKYQDNQFAKDAEEIFHNNILGKIPAELKCNTYDDNILDSKMMSIMDTVYNTICTYPKKSGLKRLQSFVKNQ